jgi:hypothetical protein
VDNKTTQTVSLTFSLPEERESFELAYYGHKYKFAIDDLKNYIRSNLKYGFSNEIKALMSQHKKRDELVDAILEHIREKLYEIESE